jgi:tetratricopeptide (TPR) repeat protein
VVGKVFWAGALVEMEERDPGEVELELHELALKELVRPARASSMEGESEYAFWHVLVRDVAYAQIPRAERARRHRAAAAWIEGKARARVEDLAEVLAYHYSQALEFAEATGEAKQAAELVVPARRFFALAGERALGLDTAQAEARLARALELTPVEDPERPERLVRWADAAFQAGRRREADEALEQALSLLRAQGKTGAAALALQLWSRLALRGGEPRFIELAEEAVELLLGEPPGPELVAAYAQLANAHTIGGGYAKAIAAADRAVALAELFGAPEPSRALGYRGFARTFLGDSGGLADMERALALLIEQGAGRDAAVLQNNIAIARYPLEGPARTLRDFEDGIVFCNERGLATREELEANCPGLLAELGRVDEALEAAGRLAASFEASGNTVDLCEVRAVHVALRLARGDHVATREVEWLIATARARQNPFLSPLALAVAALALGPGSPGRASALLTEIESQPGAREAPYFARQLPTMVRTAIAADDLAIAGRLADSLQLRYLLEEHALCAARAQLAEAADEPTEAAILYAEAAERWHEFGNVPEQAYALLGHGRCLLTLGHPGAEQPLTQTRELLAPMGYRPALNETETLLERADSAAS